MRIFGKQFEAFLFYQKELEMFNATKAHNDNFSLIWVKKKSPVVDQEKGLNKLGKIWVHIHLTPC